MHHVLRKILHHVDHVGGGIGVHSPVLLKNVELIEEIDAPATQVLTSVTLMIWAATQTQLYPLPVVYVVWGGER